MATAIHADHDPYYCYSGKQRLERAIHTLQGILEGIGIDGRINNKELEAVTGWIIDHREFRERHPFCEIIPALELAFADQRIDEEERCDLIWLCQKFSPENEYYGTLTADMQRLHGVLGGIVADKVVTAEELNGLQTWIDDNTQLKKCWPYDEIESLVMSVMADGKIDDEEHKHLLTFLSEFATIHDALPEGSFAKKESLTVKGICAACPELEFKDKLFCFTGASERATRSELVEHIENLGGQFSKSIILELDYLIVGADGNPCWAYSCYGRKVEQAVEYRRRGMPLVIAHEYDFWDAVEAHPEFRSPRKARAK